MRRGTVAAAVALLVLYGVIAGSVVWLGQERSGWVLMTHPSERLHASNSLLGYTVLYGDSVLHKENVSFVQQIALFSGINAPADLYFRRPLYAFAASHLAPSMGVINGMLVVNLASWALAAYFSYRFASRLYGTPESGLWAAAFTLAGFGFIAHALDYSAHLLSFVFYFAGVVILHESGIWERELPQKAHLLIGIFLAFACWQYNTGLALTASYVLLGLRRNKLPHVIIGAVIALSAQPLWQLFLGFVYRSAFGQELPDLSLAERGYLLRAVGIWTELWSERPAEALRRTALYASEFLWFECPLVLLAGTCALLLGCRRRELAPYAAALIAMPVIAAMLFATSAAARGYLVYGVSIFLYVALGGAIASKIRPRPVVISGAALLVCELLWNTAHMHGYLGPLKAYFLGMDHAWRLFETGAADVVSITGLEPTPYAFGGDAPLEAAGLHSSAPTLPIQTDVALALLTRALFITAGTVAVGALLARARIRLTCIGLFVAFETAALVSCMRLTSMPNLSGAPDYVARTTEGSTLEYRVALSKSFRARLEAGLDQGRTVDVYASVVAQTSEDAQPAQTLLDMSVGPTTVAAAQSTPRVWHVDAEALRRALHNSGDMVLRFAPSRPGALYYGGWQRAGLHGRELSVSLAERTPVTSLPAIEIRLLENDAPVLVGF